MFKDMNQQLTKDNFKENTKTKTKNEKRKKKNFNQYRKTKNVLMKL